MSNFSMSVTFTQSEWNGLSEAHKAYWQKLVDETCDLPSRNSKFDYEQAVDDEWGLQTYQKQSGV